MTCHVRIALRVDRNTVRIVLTVASNVRGVDQALPRGRDLCHKCVCAAARWSGLETAAHGEIEGFGRTRYVCIAFRADRNCECIVIACAAEVRAVDELLAVAGELRQECIRSAAFVLAIGRIAHREVVRAGETHDVYVSRIVERDASANVVLSASQVADPRQFAGGVKSRNESFELSARNRLSGLSRLKAYRGRLARHVDVAIAIGCNGDRNITAFLTQIRGVLKDGIDNEFPLAIVIGEGELDTVAGMNAIGRRHFATLAVLNLIDLGSKLPQRTTVYLKEEIAIRSRPACGPLRHMQVRCGPDRRQARGRNHIPDGGPSRSTRHRYLGKLPYTGHEHSAARPFAIRPACCR